MPADIHLVLALSEFYIGQNRQAEKKKATPRGRRVVNLLFETSTLTHTSFDLAGKRLGADVINMSVSSCRFRSGLTR